MNSKTPYAIDYSQYPGDVMSYVTHRTDKFNTVSGDLFVKLHDPKHFIVEVHYILGKKRGQVDRFEVTNVTKEEAVVFMQQKLEELKIY